MKVLSFIVIIGHRAHNVTGFGDGDEDDMMIVIDDYDDDR